MQLGKREYVEDPRTLHMATFMLDKPFPDRYNFDATRVAFPLSMLGNDKWGNCVIVGRANQLLRLERVERRHTPKITTADCVSEYQAECLRQMGEKPQHPGDAGDNGLYLIEALKDWRTGGWDVRMTQRATRKENHKIAAFGALDVNDPKQLRRAMFYLHGIQLGLLLPVTAQHQANNELPWDYVEGSSNNEPGSWGGHLVYCKRYDENHILCLSWGREVLMTNRFVQEYADEAWAVVDDLNSKGKYLNVPAMLAYLREIGATGIE